MTEDIPYRVAVVLVLLVLKLVRLRTGQYSGFRASLPAFRRQPADAAVLFACGLTMFAGLAPYLIYPAAIAAAHVPLPEPARWAAVATALGAIALLAWSDAALGANLSVVAQIKDRHTLVTSGPYRYVRHPIYLAGLLLFASLAVVTANGITAAALVGGMGALYAWRIPREERMLAEAFGDEYRRYAERTGRLIPRLRQGVARHGNEP